MDDLENGWLRNTPDAPWNQDDAAPAWLEDYQLAMDAMCIPEQGHVPGTLNEAAEILRDIAHAAMSGLEEMGHPMDIRGEEMLDEVKGFYRFPAMEKLDTFTNLQQVDYICGEADEARIALAEMNCTTRFEPRMQYGMKLMDIIHATETALRMEFSEEEVIRLRQRVEEKNRKRGYYGKEA